MPNLRRRRSGYEEVEDDTSRDEVPPEDDVEESPHTQAEQEEGDEAAQVARQQLVKNFVRLAIASEYSRIPLRRADIVSKALNGSSRQFKAVFADAQLALQKTFGMELKELPQREKNNLSQRKVGAASQSAPNTSNKAWVLVSILPDKFYKAGIIGPSKAPTADLESAYIGLYTFIVSLIVLAGGTLQEAKLERHLKRGNIDQSTPVDRTDRLLARMVKDGYILRHKDSSTGEEVVEYAVGPRGRVEVGEAGVRGFVREVYGDSVDADLDKKLERVFMFSRSQVTGDAGTALAGAATQGHTDNDHDMDD